MFVYVYVCMYVCIGMYAGHVSKILVPTSPKFWYRQYRFFCRITLCLHTKIDKEQGFSILLLMIWNLEGYFTYPSTVWSWSLVQFSYHTYYIQMNKLSGGFCVKLPIYISSPWRRKSFVLLFYNRTPYINQIILFSYSRQLIAHARTKLRYFGL